MNRRCGRPVEKEAEDTTSAAIKVSRWARLPLLTASIPKQPAEPVAWTFTRADGGRTFYTSLGSPSDFKNDSFTRLLRNGIAWAAKNK